MRTTVTFLMNLEISGADVDCRHDDHMMIMLITSVASSDFRLQYMYLHVGVFSTFQTPLGVFQ